MRFSALFCALLALPLLPQASHAANFELTIVHANDTPSAAAGIDGRYAACREDDACTGGYARIVEAVKDTMGASDDYITVAIQDVPADQWPKAVYKPEIADQIDRLYKKPNYFYTKEEME